MKIEVDVEMPEGYEPTGGNALSYFPPGATVLTVYVVLRKKKREVVCFVKVDEFVEYSASDIPVGWGSEKGKPSSPIALWREDIDAFPVQWYRREVREE